MASLLHFDFISETEKNTPLLFKNPIKIISTSNIDEVIPLLKEVEAETNKGYYAAGYLSYEAAPAFEKAFQVHSNPVMPLLWFGIYEKPEKKQLQSVQVFHTSEWKAQTSLFDYNNCIGQIKSYIRQGITYQVNYTIRMLSQFSGDSIAYYNQLVKAQAANYSAYLDIGDFTIVSVSPELFFHLKEGKLTTKPMKGTIERGTTPEEDQSNSNWLYHSKKNRAENVMIVDLLRNDLGMIAKPNSVKVPKLYSIEEYPTVFQMTSTVTAEISNEKTIADVFTALFPCGSITGAPKISTMDIINQLEPTPREVYCGTIGYITPDKEAIFNVPIRTVMINNQSSDAMYGIGGGITWDSNDQDEYKEALTKAKVLDVLPMPFQLLETIGLEDGTYFILENHLKRLEKSASYFNYPVDIASAKEKLQDFANTHPLGMWKVRLLSNRNGGIVIEGTEIAELTNSIPVKLANAAVDKDNRFLHHKTTNRSIYEKTKQQHPNVFDVLLWNQDHEITEFTTGNIVVEIDGKLYTPPLSSGLLPGTYREVLLEEGVISERKLLVEEIFNISKIWLINSVRKWIPVQLLK
ncbi:aminodeoxychorismate synthase component I [Oceanobacillus polygoni]|uniref:Para-aminobenzoate synthetase/4-amino-4-deoxychorismate lyase n=1 Tax=Oceanobacillus polygoni TaxID=1235259 RepID=A0A9X0YX93_9BACI|nr:aminodeoxychorismate synthase component I [Oceanobacillus polygoni]MBP2078676.1 para-aminobenzoate synthetase/4-amino-4-deoxychorismate lyase [Oceanobacillus polygoni]